MRISQELYLLVFVINRRTYEERCWLTPEVYLVQEPALSVAHQGPPGKGKLVPNQGPPTAVSQAPVFRDIDIIMTQGDSVFSLRDF